MIDRLAAGERLWKILIWINSDVAGWTGSRLGFFPPNITLPNNHYETALEKGDGPKMLQRQRRQSHKTTILLRAAPAQILSPFLPTAPLRYVPKIRFTQATIDCLTKNKTKNALHNETVILNYIGEDPISHSLINEPFINVLL